MCRPTTGLRRSSTSTLRRGGAPADGPGAAAAGGPGDDQAAGRRGGAAALDVLPHGGTLEHAQQIAGHASPKTTKLYDRTADTVTVDEIERIVGAAAAMHGAGAGPMKLASPARGGLGHRRPDPEVRFNGVKGRRRAALRAPDPDADDQ